MSIRFDAVIFDMDGTLLNTLDDLADSVNAMLEGKGYPKRTKDEVKNFLGNGVHKLIELSLPEGQNSEFEECLADFIERYKKNLQNKTAPYAGIPELLEKLVTMGVKMAVVSNKFDSAVKKINRLYFGDQIPVAVGESEQMRKKPAPDSVYAAMEKMGATKLRTLFVGDSEVDVQTAKNAGLLCAGVSWGFRDREILRREGADWIIDRPEELMGILEE
jgi:phosphoglycolate phosphatase